MFFDSLETVCRFPETAYPSFYVHCYLAEQFAEMTDSSILDGQSHLPHHMEIPFPVAAAFESGHNLRQSQPCHC